MTRDQTLHLSRHSLDTDTAAAGMLLLAGVLLAGLVAAAFAGALQALPTGAAAEYETVLGPLAEALAPGGHLPEPLWLIPANGVRVLVGAGMALAALLALLTAAMAMHAQRQLGLARGVVGGVETDMQRDGDGRVSSVRLADAVAATSYADRLLGRSRRYFSGAIGLTAASLALLVDATFIGSVWIGFASAVLLGLAVLGVVGLLPLVALGAAVGQAIKRIGQKARGVGAQNERSIAGRRWRVLVLDGRLRFDLQAEGFRRAFHSQTEAWLDEARAIADRIHDRLIDFSSEHKKGRLRGVPSGGFAKFGPKLELDSELFAPGGLRPRHFKPEGVRLKLDGDRNWRITLESSDAAFPGEIVRHDDNRTDMPDWIWIQPQREGAGKAK